MLPEAPREAQKAKEARRGERFKGKRFVLGGSRQEAVLSFSLSLSIYTYMYICIHIQITEISREHLEQDLSLSIYIYMYVLLSFYIYIYVFIHTCIYMYIKIQVSITLAAGGQKHGRRAVSMKTWPALCELPGMTMSAGMYVVVVLHNLGKNRANANRVWRNLRLVSGS